MSEEETRSTNAIATASKDKKNPTTKSSTKARGKKGRKQVDQVEPEKLVQKSPPDKAGAGNDDPAQDDLSGEEAPKVTSKKKALPKPKVKSKPKGKSKVILSENENEEEDPRSKSPIRCNQLSEDEESLRGSPQKDPRVIGDAAASKVLPFDIFIPIT